MPHMICRHRVADFEHWYAVFKEHAAAQTDSGMRVRYVMRDAEDPHMVVLWFEVDDVDAARAFTETPEAAAAGKEAGAVGTMDTWFMEDLA